MAEELNSSDHRRIMFLSLIVVACFSASSASSVFISDNIFASSDADSVGRHLLQAKTPCPVNFEFKNYTIITSRCKGPQYPPNLCCAAFKDFACPYAEELNDLSNDCSSTMFSYINLYGEYPPGLFASECRDGKLGLECPAEPPSNVADVADASSSQLASNPSLLLILAAVFLVFFSRWF